MYSLYYVISWLTASDIITQTILGAQ